jgi:hypothetical protein
MPNPGENGYLSRLDADQVLRAAWDEDNKRLRTDAEIINPSISVDLDPLEDGVYIGDADGDVLDINPDGSINTAITGEVEIEISAADGDNVAISDGTHTLDVNADGSINSVVTATNLDIRPLDALIDNVEVSGTVSVDNFPSEQVYATRVDEASSTVTYIGKAVPGTTNAASLWQISRLTQSGSVLSSEYANGSDAFNQVWNDRASLSYS